MKDKDPWGERSQMRWALQGSYLTSWRTFPDCGAEKGNPGSTQWSPWVVKIELGVWGSQVSYTSQGRVVERREIHTERTLEICRGSLFSIQLNGDHYMHAGKLPKRKQLPEKIRENSTWTSQRPGYDACLYQPE